MGRDIMEHLLLCVETSGFAQYTIFFTFGSWYFVFSYEFAARGKKKKKKEGKRKWCGGVKVGECGMWKGGMWMSGDMKMREIMGEY